MRTHHIYATQQALGLLGFGGWFAHAQIYHESSKKTHLTAILRASRVAPHQLLMWDDEPRNIKGACVYV